MPQTPPVPPFPRLRDYVAWHDAYRDPASELSVRLRHVQQVISAEFDARPGTVRVMSSCAGQGHDVLGVLAARPELYNRVRGTLLEINPVNAAIARERITSLGVDLRVVEDDASVSDAYVGAVPADLVLLVGILGNVSVEDTRRLVAVAPQFCAPGATLVWTRGSQEPDPGAEIRHWFSRAGFTELSYEEGMEGTSMRMGVHRWEGATPPLRRGVKLFTFLR